MHHSLLVKVPEHTWGVAQSWFLPDYVNWTNAQFDRARAQQPLGFIADNTHHGAALAPTSVYYVALLAALQHVSSAVSRPSHLVSWFT